MQGSLHALAWVEQRHDTKMQHECRRLAISTQAACRICRKLTAGQAQIMGQPCVVEPMRTMGGGLGDAWGGAAAGEASWDSRSPPSTSTAREASSPHAKLILTSVVLPLGTCTIGCRI